MEAELMDVLGKGSVGFCVAVGLFIGGLRSKLKNIDSQLCTLDKNQRKMIVGQTTHSAQIKQLEKAVHNGNGNAAD